MGEIFYAEQIVQRLMKLGLYNSYETNDQNWRDSHRGCELSPLTPELCNYDKKYSKYKGFRGCFNTFEDDFDLIIKPFFDLAGASTDETPVGPSVFNMIHIWYSRKNKSYFYRYDATEDCIPVNTDLIECLENLGIIIHSITIKWDSIGTAVVYVEFFADPVISGVIMSTKPMETKIGHTWYWNKGPSQFKKEKVSTKTKNALKIGSCILVGAAIGITGTMVVPNVFKKKKK